MSRLFKLLAAVATLFCGYVVLFFVFTAARGWPSPSDAMSFAHARVEDWMVDNVSNETLGFEHIYAIGLKARTDKHDFLTLAASVTGIQVEWLDGVRADEISQKALPVGMNEPNMEPNVIGCWRAHMNALSKIIENRYTTALILEDDADWDASIKLQLREIAHGVRALSKDDTAPRDAPYGTNWDVLWVGGCASGQGDNETEIYAIPDDPTAPANDRRGTWGGPTEKWKKNHPELPEDSTRFVYRADMGCCTYGYAVTYQGAQKILAALSLERSWAVDNSMSDLCGGLDGREQIRCYATFPNLIGTFRSAGSSSRDSDIHGSGEGTYHEALSWNLVYSTRLNLRTLLSGSKTVQSQWRDKGAPWSQENIDLMDFRFPKGYLVS